MINITRETVENNLMFVARWSSGYRETFAFGDNYESRESEEHYIKDIDIVCLEGQPEVIKPFVEGYLASGIFFIEDYMLSIGLIDSKVYTEAREAKKQAVKALKASKARQVRENKKPLVNSDLASQLKNLVF